MRIPRVVGPRPTEAPAAAPIAVDFAIAVAAALDRRLPALAIAFGFAMAFGFAIAFDNRLARDPHQPKASEGHEERRSKRARSAD